MIPSTFDYTAAKTLAEAVALLGENADAKILSGGQSLIPLMRFRLSVPAMIVDINHIAGLDHVREENGWLKIGALAREVDLDNSALVSEKYPLLADTTRVIADPLVRNLATVGGNLAHADPANDHPATMLAYGAQVIATGPSGERMIPITEFFIGPFESTLAQNEILTEIRIPASNGNSGGAYFKLERKVGDYATAAVAAQVTLDRSSNCTHTGIGLTNVGLTPIKATAAEESLMGEPLDDTNIRQAAQLASEEADPEIDRRGSEEYKRALVKTLTTRALRKAAERANGGSS